jgi:hypothetical protein
MKTREFTRAKQHECFFVPFGAVAGRRQFDSRTSGWGGELLSKLFCQLFGLPERFRQVVGGVDAEAEDGRSVTGERNDRLVVFASSQVERESVVSVVVA